MKRSKKGDEKGEEGMGGREGRERMIMEEKENRFRKKHVRLEISTVIMVLSLGKR